MIYQFTHPDTNKMVEVSQKMDEDHVYVDESGEEWVRVWNSPAAVIDGRLSADTSELEFMRKTSDKNYNLGQMWDLSKDLSSKREKQRGKDPVRESYLKDYSKKRKGKAPPSDQ